MTRMRSTILAAAGIIFTAAAAGAWAQSSAPLKVWAAGEITPDRYTVVKRLWVTDWRSAFRVPRHDDSGAAIAGIVDEAGRSGADGVVNLTCTQDPGGTFVGSAYYCYGLAVKLK